VVAICCSGAAGQGIHFGVKAGVPLTDYFETGVTGGLHGAAFYTSATRRYTVGATVEWRATRHFGLAADAMFHRLGYKTLVNQFNNGAFADSSIEVKGDSWDIPLVAKYRFGRRLHPFAEAGGVLRYVGPVRARG